MGDERFPARPLLTFPFGLAARGVLAVELIIAGVGFRRGLAREEALGGVGGLPVEGLTGELESDVAFSRGFRNIEVVHDMDDKYKGEAGRVALPWTRTIPITGTSTVQQ